MQGGNDPSGSVLVSSAGIPYEYVLGGGYFSNYQEGHLVIEGNGEIYRIPASEEDARYASWVSGNIFQIGNQFYEGETRKPELEGCYYGTPDYGVLFQREDGFNLILDKNNQEIYRSRLKEDILSVEDQYLTARRGSYFCVLDYDGQVVMQCLMGDLAND